MDVLIVFLISVVAFNYVHELGHLAAARLAGVRVNQMFYGVGPILHTSSGRDGMERLYGLIPVASVRFDPDSFDSATPWRRLVAASGGPLANFGCTFLLFACAYLAFSTPPAAVLDVVDENGMAATAGLRDGDRIVGIDGADTATWGDVGLGLLARTGDTGTIDLRVLRRGEVLDYAIPIERWQSDAVWVDAFASLGITRATTPEGGGSDNPLTAVGMALVDSVELGFSTAANGFKMLFGTISVLNFGGGLQLAQLGLDPANLDVGAYLMLLGLFSLAFGIINLLPGPIVDGLAMVTAAAEGVARRPIPKSARKWVFVVGSILAFGPIPLCIAHDLIRFAF